MVEVRDCGYEGFELFRDCGVVELHNFQQTLWRLNVFGRTRTYQVSSSWQCIRLANDHVLEALPRIVCAPGIRSTPHPHQMTAVYRRMQED